MRTLVLLAGGRSSRMGRDKVMLGFNGRTFVEHFYEKAAACFDRIIISTDTEEHAEVIRSLPFFDGKDIETVTDLYPLAGPIGGLLSVFGQTNADRFSVISVDIPHGLPEVLAAAYDRCSGKACFFQLEGGRPEPLIAAWSRSACADLKRSFERGNYKLRAVLDDNETGILTQRMFISEYPQFADTDFVRAFRNFNTPEELEDLYD